MRFRLIRLRFRRRLRKGQQQVEGLGQQAEQQNGHGSRGCQIAQLHRRRAERKNCREHQRRAANL